jgi:hypothetical protein
MAETINSPSLLGLIGRINHAASDIRKRTASIADVLCGGAPSPESEGKDPRDDMHSQLQRTLTRLEQINDNLARTERAIGVCPSAPQGLIAAEELCVTEALSNYASAPNTTRY